MFTHPELKKMVAAVARKQDSNVVDLAQIESDVRFGIVEQAIDGARELQQAINAGCEGADLIPADLIERILQALERAWRKEHARDPRRAAHRAARGVRKIRGAK